MPTFERTARFDNDYKKLTREQVADFRAAVKKFIPAVKAQNFPPSLRVKGVQSVKGVFEMTWAEDGRATFQYGPEVHPGEPHIVWRRIGTHKVFDDA